MKMADMFQGLDPVYLWLSILSGILFSIYLRMRMGNRASAAAIFEMSAVVFFFFSVISFFNRLLDDFDVGWPIVWQFSLRWWVFTFTAVAVSGIIGWYQRRCED